MKKICPYCGRIDELGSACKGCGYVLQVADKDAPDDVQQDKDKAQKETEQQGGVYQKYVYEEYVFNGTDAAPQPENVVKRSELKMPRKAEKAKNHTVIPKATRFLWFVLGVVILCYSMFFFYNFFRLSHTRSAFEFLNGISLGIVFTIGGLACFQELRKRPFWKYIKFVLYPCLFIGFGIPFLQFIGDLIHIIFDK